MTHLFYWLRGGAWYYISIICRSAVRYVNEPDIRNYDIGFRVVRK